MTESYEQLRDTTTGEAGAAWKAADREESNLRALYRELKEDPHYTNEHKAEQAWQRYETAKEKIAAGKTKARGLLEKQARSGERFSIPMPSGEAPATSDTAKLLASQNEASRIVRKLDRLDSTDKAPLKLDRVEVLRQEYGRGLEVCGMQGGAICRGVLAAADELGIDTDSVVDGFRKQRHHESLERAQHSERLIGLIGGSVPEPPFAKPGATRGRGSEPRKRSNVLLRPRSQPAISGTRKRRPAWK